MFYRKVTYNRKHETADKTLPRSKRVGCMRRFKCQLYCFSLRNHTCRCLACFKILWFLDMAVLIWVLPQFNLKQYVMQLYRFFLRFLVAVRSGWTTIFPLLVHNSVKLYYGKTQSLRAHYSALPVVIQCFCELCKFWSHGGNMCIKFHRVILKTVTVYVVWISKYPLVCVKASLAGTLVNLHQFCRSMI